MPTWTGSTDFVDKGRTIFKTMTGASTKAFDGVFDSEFVVSPGPGSNHMLQLKLKIFLNKFQPPKNPFTGDPFSTWIAADADGNPFIIGPWNHAEWTKFVREFLRQCNFWNDQFWLVPPADFAALDIVSGGKKIRPNVYCNLQIQLQFSPAGAHRSITVVNLDAKAAAKMAGYRETDVDSGDFRSDANTYDSMDVVPSQPSHVDGSGVKHKTRHYTIAHEVGHALGEPHIGVIRREPLCQLAILLRQVPGLKQSSLPAALTGGSNADVCYGDFADVSVSANIMGGGDKFTADNAGPWLDQVLRHTQTRTPWTVHMGRIAPKVL